MVWLGVAGPTGIEACVALCATVLPVMGLWWRQERQNAEQRRRDRALREELETYAKLDTSLPPNGDERELARRVCRVVAEKSSFPKIAMLLEDPDQNLRVTGSAGFDDVTVEALDEWGVEAMREGRKRYRGDGRSFAITVRPHHHFDVSELETVRCYRVLMMPIEAANGRLRGALAACSFDPEPLEGSRIALEMLAVRLGDAIENHRLSQELRRAAMRSHQDSGERLAVA